MNSMKLREIAEKAIAWMYDNGELREFLEDQDIELDDREKEYFGVEYFEEMEDL